MKDANLILGTLLNDESHNLITPLMAPESLLDERRIENGIQYIFTKKKLGLLKTILF